MTEICPGCGEKVEPIYLAIGSESLKFCPECQEDFDEMNRLKRDPED